VKWQFMGYQKSDVNGNLSTTKKMLFRKTTVEWHRNITVFVKINHEMVIILFFRTEKVKAYGTPGSQAVSNPSTNKARRCLTCQIGRDGVRSAWYGRIHLR
jgi:hypothetical protein